MKHAKAGGFTLIETVISLTLLSFITIIGYQGLVFGMNQWRNGHDKMQHQYDYHQALGWMRDKLGSAEKVTRIGSDDRAYLFEGMPDSVEFVGRYDRTRRGGLYVSKVFIDTRDHSINVSYYLHHPDIARNIDSDINSRTIPPPTRNDGRLVPSRVSILSPNMAASDNTAATVIAVRTTARLRSREE